MKNKRNNQRQKKEQLNLFINGVTQHLADRFNGNLDEADYLLAELEAIALVLKKANCENATPETITAVFQHLFPQVTSRGYISEGFETKIKNYLTAFQTQN